MQSREAVSIEDAALLRGIKPNMMVKTMVLRDMGNQYALACCPGDRQIDPKKVRAQLQFRRMTCVDSKEIKSLNRISNRDSHSPTYQDPNASPL